MIRAFVGISLPGPVLSALNEVQAGLPTGKPVATENFHITVAFLGEHPEPLVEDIHLALKNIRATAFELALTGAGLFGRRRPRVFYAGIRPEPRLNRLRTQVLRAVSSTGLQLPRTRYSPHVTLARFNSSLTGEMAQKMRDFAAQRMSFEAGPFVVNEFLLIRSMLGRTGPAYQHLAAYPLSTASKI